MQLLSKEFKGVGEVSGVVFTQLFRFEDLCLYKRSDGCFEVIRARIRKAGTSILGGRTITFIESEKYPTGDNWGRYEYCCNTLDRAIERYNGQAQAMKYEIALTKEMLSA